MKVLIISLFIIKSVISCRDVTDDFLGSIIWKEM